MAVQITVEDLSPIKKKIGVALPPEEVRAEIEQAYRGLQQRARIKGFRPGHVPRAVLERYYGEQVRSEVIGKLIQDSYLRALEEHHLHAVARPEIVADEVKPEVGLRYSATIEIKPTFDVTGYDGLEAERKVAPVSEEAIDAQIERFRQSLAQFARREDRDDRQIDRHADGSARRHTKPGTRSLPLYLRAIPPSFFLRLFVFP